MPKSSEKPLPTYHWTLERSLARNGPWRYLKSLTGGYYAAIRAGLEAREGETWFRVVPDGKVHRALVIRPGD